MEAELELKQKEGVFTEVLRAAAPSEDVGGDWLILYYRHYLYIYIYI